MWSSSLRAEREPRLERVEVRTHAEIRLGEPRETLVVRNPVTVEEDRASFESELRRKRYSPIRHRHLGDGAARVLQPEEQTA